eukprot:211832_1
MASLRTYKRKRNRDDKAGLQRKKQKQCHPRNRPYVIMNYDSVIQREKDIIFNGLRMAPTHLHDDIKLVIFEYVKSPFEHLGATFLHKHKSMQLVIYGHGYNKYTIQKCDNCFAFFNQKCDNYQYEDPNIKDWFIHQEFQCCFCQKNLCRDCGGLPFSNFHPENNKFDRCVDEGCKIKDGPHGTARIGSLSLYCRNECGTGIWCNRHKNCSECGTSKRDCGAICDEGFCEKLFCSKTYKTCPSDHGWLPWWE